MSFYEFLQSFVGDDTPLGKLADYVEQDVNFPREETLPENILEYFNAQPLVKEEYIETVKRSLAVFEDMFM
ncbi:sterile alpha motif-like domain-containing protein [Staphylococcus sp. SQ8-PEA]|uniref:Sterile alpha motif-like domain-containing protein n=1 Tax=Staphylococcus marylandisciuri TaxID=2981529 RepID=A0ABT2QQM1_9STAP|nr:sterile alpha motif-like domain-containing protein [Staphylococcus marylandisciuri]MCU5746252.1 sterile alpha motif-like domain-containing protein [Staphylococcus marylandisciuri]